MLNTSHSDVFCHDKEVKIEVIKARSFMWSVLKQALHILYHDWYM